MLLIVPRCNFLVSDRVMPPLGAMTIKAAATEHHIDICDDDSYLEKAPNYDIIGVSCTTPQYKSAIEIAKSIKNKVNIKIVIGGPHTTHNHNDIDQIFDYVFVGDSELTINQFLNSPTDRIVFGKKIHTGDWGNIPVTWRDKKFLAKYNYNIKDVPATTMITGKDCPMGCGFCEHAKSGISLKPLSIINQELADINDCGYRSIMFYDDIFAINKQRVFDLCSIIKPYNFIFRCFVHASTFDDEMAKTLYDAGCRIICWGAESCDERILKNVGKSIRPDDNYRVARTILNNNMDAVAFCMIGLPGEDYRSISATEDFIASFSTANRFSFDYTIFYPYKGTYIWQHRDQFDIKIDNHDTIGYYKGLHGESECCISTSTLSSDDIIRERHRICSNIISVVSHTVLRNLST